MFVKRKQRFVPVFAWSLILFVALAFFLGVSASPAKEQISWKPSGISNFYRTLQEDDVELISP